MGRMLGVALLSVLGLFACSGKVITPSHQRGAGGSPGGDAGGPDAGHSTNLFVDVLSSRSIDKVDLLFMVDNSISMADKQDVLKDAVPDLVQRLVNPSCVDPATGAVGVTPSDPSAPCPAPLVREFAPLRDIHVGIVTSSIGGHGSSLCSGMDPMLSDVENEENDDHGHLIGSRPRYKDPRGGYPADPSGFLDWNPDANGGETLQSFTTTFQSMVGAAGEHGCGLESQLESTYHFLVDPNPYQTIVTQNCPGLNEPCAVPTGKDMTLLAQRQAFLRPDSLVAIVLLTDENDCSIRESGQDYYAARLDIILPHGSSECATNPNDPCCYFCNDSPPAGCAADPSCSTPTEPALDPPNLRCFRDKQRFGRDFLYPTARYVNAFTQRQLCTSRPDLAPDPQNCPDLDGDKKPDLFDNPLFVGNADIPRDPSLVFLAGIVGVPWQDIQAEASPDATATPYPTGELHYRTATQMMNDGTWDTILGNDNPGSHVPPIPPTDNLMTESKDPRGGADGENPPRPLAGTDASENANPVNGHEWVNSAEDDLQYACIFKLPEPRDCLKAFSEQPPAGCDCKPNKEVERNPLCQKGSTYGTTQYYAKAYPGLRELQVLKDFGSNSIVASICARNLDDSSKQDYGYRPAVDAIVERLKGALAGKCLARTLTSDPKTGEIPCSIIEARPVPSGGAPACSSTPGRTEVPSAAMAAAKERLHETKVCSENGDAPGRPDCAQFYFCAIDEAGDRCHQNQTATEVGWCYVDPETQPGDDPTLVAGCPTTERRIIRFVDPMNATPANDATVLVTCSGLLPLP